MKKGLLIFFTLVAGFIGVYSFEGAASAENKTFKVIYNREILPECVDIERFAEYRKVVERHYLKKNAREIDEDFMQYITPACAPYGAYIKDFDKRAQRVFSNSVKKDGLPLSLHLRITVDREGKIEQKGRMYCEDYENFSLISAEDEDCARALKVVEKIKLPKFEKEMEFDYLTFDTNFINFKSGKKPPKVISSMPVRFGKQEAQNNETELKEVKHKKELENIFYDNPQSSKYYYERLFYKQN